MPPRPDSQSPHARLLALGLLLYGLLPFSGQAAEKPHAPESIPGAITVSAEQVVELILSKPGLILIDSRKKSEYAKGHIEGAISLLNTGMEREDLAKISADKSATLIFYCNGPRCLRSAVAIRKAMAWGYRNVFWFRGGWKEWTDKRLPAITD